MVIVTWGRNGCEEPALLPPPRRLCPHGPGLLTAVLLYP